MQLISKLPSSKTNTESGGNLVPGLGYTQKSGRFNWSTGSELSLLDFYQSEELLETWSYFKFVTTYIILDQVIIICCLTLHIKTLVYCYMIMERQIHVL